MGVTLREVLALDGLRQAGARVVAGFDQLDRPVRWVHIAEIADIATLIKGGELLLSTGLGLGSSAQEQRRYIASIADAGACGLVVELGRQFSSLPTAMVQAAVSRSFPLIALERPTRYIEVTEAVHRALISQSYDLLRRATDISRDFTDLILGGAGVAEIVARLAAIFGNPVVLEDAAHNVICASSPSPDTGGSHVSLSHPPSAEAVSEGPGCLWTSIWLRHEVWGRVHVLSETADEITGLVLDRAGAALGLALLAQKDEAHLVGRAGSALLVDVLAGRHISTAEFVRRARGLGVELNGGRLVGMVVAPGPVGTGEAEQERQRARLAVCDDVRRAARDRGCAALAGLDGDRVLCVLSVPGAISVTSVADEIVGVVRRRALSLIAGVGRTVSSSGASGGAASLRRSLEEAVEAAEFGLRMGSDRADSVYHFGSLGVYQLLSRLAEDPELGRFVDAELGAVLAHDARSHARLLPTLRCYLDCAGRKADTARILRVQRRTLYARLSRLAAILGRDLDTADSRLRLMLALQAYDMLQGSRVRRRTGLAG